MKNFPFRIFTTLVIATLCLTLLSAFGIFGKVHTRSGPVKLHDSWQSAGPGIESLQSGDLIFRQGRGFISDAFCKLSLKDHRYSHVGIIHIENNKAYVYHAIGGEENVSNKMKKESLESFCDASVIHAFGIYKLNLSVEEKQKMDALAGNYYHSGLEFDTKFDLNSDDKMYCTELVYKILFQVKGDKNLVPITSFAGKNYVACDNIQLSSVCSEIYSYVYSF